jgi:hypothetical protein
MLLENSYLNRLQLLSLCITFLKNRKEFNTHKILQIRKITKHTDYLPQIFEIHQQKAAIQLTYIQ